MRIKNTCEIFTKAENYLIIRISEMERLITFLHIQKTQQEPLLQRYYSLCFLGELRTYQPTVAIKAFFIQ